MGNCAGAQAGDCAVLGLGKWGRALARSRAGLAEYAEQWTETGTGEVLRPVWDTVGGWAGDTLEETSRRPLGAGIIHMRP